MNNVRVVRRGWFNSRITSHHKYDHDYSKDLDKKLPTTSTSNFRQIIAPKLIISGLFYAFNYLVKVLLSLNFAPKILIASRKSKGIFRTPDGIEKLLRTWSKTCRPSIRLSGTQGTAGFMTFAR